MEDAREAAVAKLAELLKHPDDLNTKVGPLARKLAKEKASIDAQLNTGVQTQLDNVQGGLETLASSRDNSEKIKDNMQLIDRLCYDAQSMIKDFPRIKKISRIHQNFVATQQKVQSLQELYQRLNDIEEMFAPMQHDIFMYDTPLLHVHYHLYKLEEFRDQTMHQARDSPHDVIITLKTYFRRLDVLSDDFTQYLWEISRNLLPLVDRDCGTTIVKLAKIIELEEKADEKALAAKQAQTSHQDLQGKGGWRLAEGNPRTIKSCRVEFFEQLHQSLRERFEEELAPYRDNEDWMGALDATDFIFNDLELVFDEIVPKFPKKYKIFPYFVLEYHRHTYDFLNHMVNQDLDAGTILRLLRFVRDYYSTMSTRLGVTEELLEPQLLDGQEQSLVDEYLKLVRSKLVEWTSNLMSAESRDFVQRHQPPEMTSDGQYGMTGAVDMFQIINQQIDVAADANQGKLLYLVVNECHKVMKDSQSFWRKLLASETRKQLDEPEQAPEGFVEYVMAMSNDQIKCADFAEEILNRIIPQVEGKYKAQVQDKLNMAVDGYMQIAASGREALLEVTFNDVKPVFHELFTPRWYEQPLIPSVIETLKDYCQDFATHLNEFLFNKLMNDTLERFIMLYLEAMRRKGAKFHMEVCPDNIQKDIRLSFNFFAKYKSMDELEERFDVIDKVHTLLNSNRRMIFVDYYSLRQAYPDVPLAFVEDILSKRDDLDKAALKDIVEGIKAKAREYEPNANTPPTIFSRIKW
ncbi:exocyst complex component Sec6-domain-containing protein [Phascolomyces articulosus]|uniref:Exocyst complex component Sec6-domain-containing protein n=1 Tax=Phascolomyces articulosus TaxID=60185 RepID=A0AAD5JR98_9FUNG|nr:exocyst complex component Sec6-domain-containing protein [Phascolomyces articulosus]